jgi:hypothetical protein
MNKNLKTISFAFAMFAVVGMISSTSVAFADDDETELEAKLLDNLQNEIGEVSFEDEDGQTELEIEIESLADQSCEVSINGVVVPEGPHLFDDEGELELEPSPITVNENDAITVVVCGNQFSGTFTLDVDDDDEEDDDDDEEEIQSSKKIKSNNRRV